MIFYGLSRHKKLFGVLLSLALVSGSYLGTAGSGLSNDGRTALATVVFAVSWWALRVVPPAFTALAALVFLVVSGTATPGVVFGFWSGSMAWLMVGAFLLATAVTSSGLARRIALHVMRRTTLSYVTLVVVVYLLNILLAVFVPLPFPRAFIVMALVSEVLERTGAGDRMRASLGFAVFAGSVPASMMFLTGESVLNPVTAEFAGGLTWLNWFVLMGLPSLVSAGLMVVAQLVVFKPTTNLAVDTGYIEDELRDVGPLSAAEARTLAWVALAVGLWVTDAWHGIDPGWVAVGAAVGLSLPWVGDVLHQEDLTGGVDWPTLLFATGALAIGTVGTQTGLAEWLVSALIPSSLPASVPVLLALVAVAGFVLHLFIGSVLATLSMLVPAVVAFAAARGMGTAAPALIIYTVSVMGFALPFHNLMILVGAGKTGGFGEGETLRFFPAQAVVTALVVGVELLWWKFLGYI